MKTWFLPVLALGLSCLSVQAGDIVALCIGNDEYVNPEDQLDTPGNDAQLMHDTLRRVPGVLPEDIVLLKNAQRNQMSLALRQFRSRAASAKLALVFYSGHGVEDTPTGYDRAETFLLPVDAHITSVDDLPDSAIPLRDVLSALEGTRGAARAVILDCCRSGARAATKALAGSTKNLGGIDEDVKRALGSAILPDGTLIAFAASPGRKAAAFLTEADSNSPFTLFLTDQMRTQGGDLFSIVNAASRTTKQRTEMRQVPHVELRGDASIITDFVIPASQPLAGLTTPPTTPPANETDQERKAREEAQRRITFGKIHTVMNAAFAKKPTLPRLSDLLATAPGSASIEKPFLNTLGMKFVPVLTYQGGEKVLFSIWETRRKDYAAYKNRDAGDTWKKLQLEDDESLHPASSVSWEEAAAFCAWLTQVERQGGCIGLQDEYRLPTDLEWSYAVGIGDQETATATPDVKDSLLDGVYPWGKSFPPPANTGNYADIKAKAKESGYEYLEGYSDGFATTSPAGSYPPNALGLYDLGGNVWEWCQDWYNAEKNTRVLRGGSWYDAAPVYLRSASRFPVDPTFSHDFNGFRCVLVVAKK
ncbi:caspase domain-containing protein [Prosthecobacter fusiformis]|uniref:Caspase domain-containing protein n=1 Tax=Prosthecobacter fusiformis TaxID=48464 RepID=A0A4R7RPB2_9BACT|nr:SUMF1/EgtB/PvdO family nonheme iron enzyme [Prosthecobacter fusiformis]TDU67301.1 caspase domain-containing protein [Prosthecobacter fusiformis]